MPKKLSMIKWESVSDAKSETHLVQLIQSWNRYPNKTAHYNNLLSNLQGLGGIKI